MAWRVEGAYAEACSCEAACVMNLLWSGALTGLMAMEKLAPKGAAKIAGGAMIGTRVAELIPNDSAISVMPPRFWAKEQSP